MLLALPILPLALPILPLFLPILPVVLKRQSRDRKVHACDQEQNGHLRPQIPLLVVLRQPDQIESEPGHKAVYQEFAVFLESHNRIRLQPRLAE